jgi:hypothetical protein
MSENNQPPPTPSANQSPAPSLANTIVDQIFGTVDKTDAKAADARVAQLRIRHPAETDDDLAERLIRQRCLQAGAVGAATSGATIIPGLGSVATLVFGVAADLQMTYKLQTELVLELAAVYGRPVSLEDKRYVAALVTGMSAGANQVVRRAGVELAEKATERLAGRALAKSIPVVGVAASASINIVATYLIGRRAQAYYRQDPTTLGDWDDQIRLLTGVDERKLLAWVTESTEQSLRQIGRGAKKAVGVAAAGGQAAGKLAGSAASQAGVAAGATWQRVKSGAYTTAARVSRWRRGGDQPAGAPPTSPDALDEA